MWGAMWQAAAMYPWTGMQPFPLSCCDMAGVGEVWRVSQLHGIGGEGTVWKVHYAVTDTTTAGAAADADTDAAAAAVLLV